MAGGLFGRPFAVNPKCVAFAIVVIAALLACPRFPTPGAKLACLVAVFVASYVAMAWYDHFFDCGTLPLKRGPAWGPTQVFKPPAHRPEEQNREDVHAGGEKRAQLVYGMHLIIIAPLLGYVALKGARAPKQTWTLLGALAVLTAAYHGGRLLQGSSLFSAAVAA